MEGLRFRGYKAFTQEYVEILEFEKLMFSLEEIIRENLVVWIL